MLLGELKLPGTSCQRKVDWVFCCGFFLVALREKASLLGINKERNLLNSNLAFKALVGCLGQVLVPCQAEPLFHPGSAALLVHEP